MFSLNLDKREVEEIELELTKTIKCLSELNMVECSPDIDERIYNLSNFMCKIKNTKIEKKQFCAETVNG